MNEAQQRLLARILASKHFASADSLRRLLQYLCEHIEAASIKEHEIAVNVLGRSAEFDPKIDPIVRVSVGSIRQRLQAYFEMEGRNEGLRLMIPRGQYRAVFTVVNEAEGGESSSTAIETFWRPYLTGAAENLLIFTELLFFRNDAGNFLRNIFVNDLSAAPRELPARFSGLDLSDYKPSYHFVSAGEMHCVLSLTNLLAGLGARIETKNSRFSSWNALRHANLILLGSARTNSFNDSLQGRNNFVLTTDQIENRRPRPGEAAAYRGRRFMDGKLEKLTEYAIVTRRPGLTPGRVVTMIMANHGRAIEGVGDYLTNETQMQSLFAHLQCGSLLPEHFELLLRVDMIDFDEEVVEVEYVTHRLNEAAPR
jgi:hypothetical protein